MSVAIGDRVRSSLDGQIGHIVEREDGGIGVRLDRRGENRVVPYSAQQWLADKKPPLGPMQVARIAYDADRALRQARGEYSVRDWMNVPEPQRIEFSRKGPPLNDEERCRLYDAVMKALEGV